jgi:hypothetical protein
MKRNLTWREQRDMERNAMDRAHSEVVWTAIGWLAFIIMTLLFCWNAGAEVL